MTPANHEGGDVAAGASPGLLLRHLANYVAAVSLADRLPGPVGTLVDVGAGTGALAVWAQRRLRARRLDLVDHDGAVRRIARAAWPEVGTHADVHHLPAAHAELVTAMEVLEHIRPSDQRDAVRAMADIVAPGGLLVASTPDERGYVGGWSGYAPHIGVLDPISLAQLLADATGWPHAVWRLVGGPFALGLRERVGEPAVNRARSGLGRLAPKRLAALEQASSRARSPRTPPVVTPVTAIAAGGGHRAARAGSGLLAVAARPRLDPATPAAD